eukprot:c3892_g1_i1.p1 GENE.c3892_g1_i1~~c3892_g1_i1.p1  ORF type:complete len:304 (+),score=42.99 c3892_g1_i1:95-1006(+)
MALLAAVEAGGTAFKVAVVRAADLTSVEESVIATTSNPEETLAAVVAWLSPRGPFAAVGCAAFGPIDLNRSSPTFGFVTTTPKPGWQNFDIRGTLARAFGVPVGFDTDVNAAALAELAVPRALPVAAAAATVVYITVGTGVGVGLVVEGRPVHGLIHPEGGHFMPPRHRDETISGVCPFHGGCIEGFTCAAAASARFGVPASELASVSDSDPRWAVHAHYLAHLCSVVTLLVSPHVIILGGGLSNREIVLSIVRRELVAMLGGYIASPLITDRTGDYIVGSGLAFAGMAGAAVLAKRAAEEAQ